jgi:tRNA-specific 2-thiouridylase
MQSSQSSTVHEGRPLIVVALSGGVDSATAAGLLVEAGCRVVGISMRLFHTHENTPSSKGRCCGSRDIEDARRVAEYLGIPFYVVDYEEAFNRHVVDNFVAEYAAGRTPNPCVRCNQHIKFTPLLTAARSLGATALCTGHYARIVSDEQSLPRLKRARDGHKDQSYFLFNMPREALTRVRFPLGDLTKEEVRAHARRLGLPNAEKAESQEICFVPDGDYAGFVAARALVRKGALVDEHGTVLGKHQGIHHFTIGQRRGIGIPAESPRYVLGVDAALGEVRVGPRELLGQSRIDVDEVVWWGSVPKGRLRARVQIRHRHEAVEGWVEPRGAGKASVEFDVPERAPAPGQAAVFYDAKDTIIGGGFIVQPTFPSTGRRCEGAGQTASERDHLPQG